MSDLADTVLLAYVESCGASFHLDEQGHLKLKGAAGVPVPVRAELVARRKEIAALLRERAAEAQNALGADSTASADRAGVFGRSVARMTLSAFAASGQVVRMESEEFGKVALVADGAEEPAGFVSYSVAEARRVLEMEPAMRQLVHQVKATFGGRLLDGQDGC